MTVDTKVRVYCKTLNKKSAYSSHLFIVGAGKED